MTEVTVDDVVNLSHQKSAQET